MFFKLIYLWLELTWTHLAYFKIVFRKIGVIFSNIPALYVRRLFFALFHSGGKLHHCQNGVQKFKLKSNMVRKSLFTPADENRDKKQMTFVD